MEVNEDQNQAQEADQDSQLEYKTQSPKDKSIDELEETSALGRQNIDELSILRGDKSTSAIGFLKGSENYVRLSEKNTESVCDSDLNSENIDADVEIDIVSESNPERK